jgi:diguanylate cyclase (GGDEF)-like protein
MKRNFGNEPQERIASVIPAKIAGVFILSAIIAAAYFQQPESDASARRLLVFIGIGGIAYVLAYHRLQMLTEDTRNLAFANSIIAGIILGALMHLMPDQYRTGFHALAIVITTSMVITGGRTPAYAFIAIISAFEIDHALRRGAPPSGWITLAAITAASAIIVEAIQQSKSISRLQIHRLEIINKVSKQMVSTLETPELINLIDLELKKLMNSDTYFIGVQKNSNIHMELFYDDGEYFNGFKFDMEGSLSKWVIQNQSPLFLPDLRKTVKIEGVDITLAGKDKESLSWMGVPMKGIHVNGLIAIASYNPNAFNRSDLELLANIAQLVAFALDNSYHHAQVEEQTRLDSLTRVYNHSYFIQTLHEQAETCLALQQPLSLIMLDIDYFKQYNDSFGHPIGDEILVSLCQVIREHIKQGDAVGRWGGEEFGISLPNATKQQAHNVAERIRETLANFNFSNTNFAKIAVPTISMGIAEFPAETKDVNKLIYLADKRLYVAKERGRDQIEPTF